MNFPQRNNKNWSSIQRFNNCGEGSVQADYFGQPASLGDKDWCLNVLGSDTKLSQNYFCHEYKAQTQHLAAETVWQFRWEVVSGDVNEDASRLLQIYLLSYGRADANAAYNLHSGSPSFLHTATSSSNTVGHNSSSSAHSLQDPTHKLLKTPTAKCVCVCVWHSFNSRWYFWNLLEHFTNPIILRVFHMSSAACCTPEWKLTGVLPRGMWRCRCAVGSFAVSRSGFKCKCVFTIAVFVEMH